MRKVWIACFAFASVLSAQQAQRVWTIQELFTRNVGSTEQQNKEFTPHKIIGNVYYIGTESLSSFLITTPQGHILINSIYERNVPTIQDSVKKPAFVSRTSKSSWVATLTAITWKVMDSL